MGMDFAGIIMLIGIALGGVGAIIFQSKGR